MKTRKALLTAALSAGMTLCMLSTAFAETWKVDFNGWWYEDDNGNRLINGWKWIDGDGDGYAECYYFGADGYLAHNREINGFTVNENGHWVAGNEVQREHIGGGTAGGQNMAAYGDSYRQ